jgi:putative aldouronate transport system substrate-binding protein
MKRKMVTKLFSCLLASLLLLAGCTSSKPNDSSAPSQTASGSSTTSTEESTSNEPITFPLKEKQTLTAFVITPFAGSNGDYQDNWVTSILEKEENIRIDFQTCTSGEDGKTKLNLLMASGDKLPDILLATKWTKAETMLYGQQGLIIPLNDYLKDCETWNKLNEVCPDRLGQLTMSDGNVYCYGNTNETLHSMYQARMWIYKPWVEKLMDGKMPTTTEELYQFLTAVKNEDPNGNGIQDEIPMTGCIADGSWATDPTTFLSNAFLQNNNILSNTNAVTGAGFVVNDGKVEFQFSKDEYKDALAYMNKLFKEGLLDSQTFTQDTTQMKASVQGETPLVACVSSGGFPCDTTELRLEQPGPYQDWTVLEPLEGPDGVRLAAYYPVDYFQTCCGVVTKDCANPELAVKLFDLLATEEWTLTQQFGEEGIGWEYVNEGTSISGGEARWKTIDPPAYREDGTGGDYTSLGIDFVKNIWDTDACVLGNTSELRLSRYAKDPSMNSEGLLYSFGNAYSQYTPEEGTVLPSMAYTSDDAKRISEYSVSIGQYTNQATVQFITGDLDIEKDWASYLSALESMDLEGYVALQQAAYDTYMENFG